MPIRRSLAAVGAVVGAAALGLGLAAVADDRGTDDGAPPRPRPAPIVSSPVFDWVTHDPVDLGEGWTVADMPGDGPYASVLHDGSEVGFLEYGTYDFDGTIDEHVAEYVRVIGDDRANGPIAGYRFTADAATHATAADGPIVRYGFTGTLPDGSPSERTYQWAGIRDGKVVLVTAAANDPGGLFSPEGVEFTTAQLESIVERLDRLIRASGLPDPA
jgi:hypothetical protein